MLKPKISSFDFTNGCSFLNGVVKENSYKNLLGERVGWRGGSAVKSTDCSSRGPEFNSMQLHGGSRPSAMGSDARTVYSYT